MPLPPQPIVTRWGTWLEAASYYAQHFDKIKDVLSSLRSSDAVSIRNAKTIFEKENLKNDLIYIKDNYCIIQHSLKELQKHNLSLTESLLLFDEVRVAISACNSESIKNKMEYVMERNPDLDTIREYSEAIEKNEASHLIPFYKFAPLSSCDVERSFSTYKWILDVKRNRLKPENIEKLMVIYFNCGGKNYLDEVTDMQEGLEVL